ncbi:hypothetical protein AB1M95_17920 [Sulfitobacter sp. LCG007]
MIAEDKMERRARQNGLSDAAIAIMTGYFRAARAGELDRPDPTLARLLGREPVPMRDVLAGASI